jgi:FixJ family two-component response regulator
MTFASAPEFLEARRENLPSCLILDVGLPGLSGLDLQRNITERGVQLPIIFITGRPEVPAVVQAMKAGAVEFLAKPFSDEKLLAAVYQAVEKDKVGRRGWAELATLRDRFETLTRREREVMHHVVTGLLNKQTAGELGTSEVTVKLHRGRVMQKMSAGSIAELVRMSERLSSEKS